MCVCARRPLRGLNGPHPDGHPAGRPKSRSSEDLLEELGEPLEALGVAHALHDTDHEELHGAHTAVVVLLDLAAIGHVLVKTEDSPQLILGGGGRDVDLVAQDDKRHVGEGLVLEQPREFLAGLLEAGAVRGVHNEDDAVDSGEVVLPDAARRLVAAEVVGAEADVLDHQLLRMRVQRRHVSGHAVVLKHVQERRLACIVQAQEEDLGILVVQSEVAEHIPEPVDDEHGL
mmetsp:Transcript_36614/g.117727  ORF Transcript_36614/g.117727 Transcript_36614/m.117727 type:complete len:230 (+) Transcript_36614:1-690(+)